MFIDGHAHAAGDYATVDAIQRTIGTYHLDKVILCTSPKNNLALREPPNIPFLTTPNSIFLLNKMLRMGYRALKDNGDGNAYVAGLSKSLPGTIIPFLWVNPLDPQHVDSMEQNIGEYQARGIKLHQCWDPFAIDGPAFAGVAETARAHGLPIFIHLYSQGDARKLLDFVRQHPGVVFIIGHLLGLDVWQEDRRALKNVYFDTSGSSRVRGQDILRAINLFGDDHVVFGSDTPYAPLGDQIDKLQRLSLPAASLDRILGLNLQSLLSLDQAPTQSGRW